MPSCGVGGAGHQRVRSLRGDESLDSAAIADNDRGWGGWGVTTGQHLIVNGRRIDVNQPIH